MKKGESRYVKQNLRRSESRKIGKRKRTWNGKLGSRIHVRTEKGKTRDNVSVVDPIRTVCMKT